MNEGKTDYRSMYDREYLAAFDLDGKDRVLTIKQIMKGINGPNCGSRNMPNMISRPPLK